MSPRRTAVLLTAATAALGLLTAAPALAAGSPGAPGAGDPYFPTQGNGGYDVAHYALHIAYTPATKQLAGTARLTARTTQALSRFDLDLQHDLVVRSVRVDGAAAAFAQPADQPTELVITPPGDLPAGRRFTVDVAYRGTAAPVTDPDGSLDGFIPTDDGAFVAGEPQGARSWFPVNDTPRDKATYAVSVTVPAGLTAVSNGALVGHRSGGGHDTWSWRLDRPVSSYLVTATIGRFDVRTGTTPGGVPYVVAVDPREAAAAAPALAQLPDIVDYFSQVYGRYPFGQAGAIVDHAHFVGYALETATRPLFDRAPSVATLSHELAHQWYGDDVTLARWRDIFLNEGFAEFSSWLWGEHTGGPTTAQRLASYLAQPPSATDEWKPPPGNPGSAENIFSGSVYDRGAATLAALRQQLGDATFFAIMRGWVARHAYGNATVRQFTTYAQAVAGQDLTAFFRTWLYSPHQP